MHILGEKTPRRVCSFRNGVLVGFGDDFWWHTKVPTMVPHMGTGGWLHKNQLTAMIFGQNQLTTLSLVKIKLTTLIFGQELNNYAD